MKRQVIALMGLGLAATLLTGCGMKPVVGVLLATSGRAATYGESMKKGIDLAFEHAKAEGKFTIPEVINGDSASDPEKAVSEVVRMAGEGADLIIAGITSDEAKAILPVLDERRLHCLSPSASAPDLTRDSEYFYRLFTSDDLEGQRAGRFLFEEKGHSSTVIYSPASEQARGIEPPFRQMFEQTFNGKVVGRVLLTEEGWETTSTDILTAYAPESAYILGYGEDTLRVLRHLKEKGFEGTICATSAFASGEVITNNAELVEEVFFPQPSFDMADERKVAQDFIAAYRQKYRSDPDIYAAHAYDAVNVVLLVLSKTARLDPSELQKAMRFDVKEYPGVTGIIQFDDFGNVRHNPVMFLVKDGQVLNHKRYIEDEKKRIALEIKKLLAGG